ncbi:MAG: hypothetical protein J0H74_08715 [Chitinophagaceae bacterium]|nr:hypothetical protein [Chitinophagaceae bacterium]
MRIVFSIKKVLLLASTAAMISLLTGCYKYKEQPQVANPAYIRVFNSIPFTVDAMHAGQAAPFLCFLVDPVKDADGIANGGAIVGDWLHTRELFSLSYAADAATAMNAQSTINVINTGLPTQNVVNANYEYPGKLHVLTSPPMNGMDMSAWAQMPSGKHHIIFVTRPEDDRPFSQLPGSLRKNVIIDTTVDLQAGEVYTINALATDIDKNQYGADVRHEQFVHEKFDPGRIYAAFYNLSSVRPYLATDPHFPFYWYYADTMTISYTCWINDDNYSSGGLSYPAWPLPGSDNVYMTTLYRGKNDGTVFTPLPFLSRDYFFDQQGVLRTMVFSAGASNTGTMPFYGFKLTQTSPSSLQYGTYPNLLCNADPANFNTQDPNVVNVSGSTPLNGPKAYNYQASLFRVIQSGTSLNIYPTVNIFEVINDRIYLMQMQRDFEKVPQ